MTIGELFEEIGKGWEEAKNTLQLLKTAVLNTELSTIFTLVSWPVGLIAMTIAWNRLTKFLRKRKLAQRTFKYFRVKGRDGVFYNLGETNAFGRLYVEGCPAGDISESFADVYGHKVEESFYREDVVPCATLDDCT